MSNERQLTEHTLRTDGGWQELVRQKVASLRFGTVLITVHDGEVVQVDCTDRTRFHRSGNPPRDTGSIDPGPHR